MSYAHSDWAYLVEPKAKSRAGGFFYLSNLINNIEKGALKLNGPVYVLCKTLLNVVSSTDE